MDRPLENDLRDEIKKQGQGGNCILKHMFDIYSKKCPPNTTTY